ncbi:MAG: putative membrane protein [Francisellaceae bacterium]|jgi:uncharacterized membrane protein
MRKILAGIIAILIIGYPFIIYLGIDHFNLRYIILIIAFIFLLRLMLINKKVSYTPLKIPTMLITLVGIIICLLGAISGSVSIIKLYPVMINLLFLTIFVYSLTHQPCIIERLARITQPDLPPEAIAYTYKVTIAWCMFFVCNGLISLLTVLFASMKVWALYNGFISYILIGTFFAIEFLIRILVKQKHKRLS